MAKKTLLSRLRQPVHPLIAALIIGIFLLVAATLLFFKYEETLFFAKLSHNESVQPVSYPPGYHPGVTEEVTQDPSERIVFAQINTTANPLQTTIWMTNTDGSNPQKLLLPYKDAVPLNNITTDWIIFNYSINEGHFPFDRIYQIGAYNY
jgi:hypothetical protein